MKKSSVALASIGGLVLLLFSALAIRFIIDISDGYERICSLESPVDDAWIEISSPNFNEVAEALVYEVRSRDQVRIPCTYFDSVSFSETLSQDSFKLINGPASSLVGVVFTKHPDVVVVMHDFATNESWPHGDGTGGLMFSRLRTETGKGALSLGR